MAKAGSKKKLKKRIERAVRKTKKVKHERPKQKASSKRVKPVSRKSVPRPSQKTAPKHGKKGSARKGRAGQANQALVRKVVPKFIPPTPAPETTPRLLDESKSTTSALTRLEKGIKLIYQKEFKRARQEFESISKGHPAALEIIARAQSYLQICAREEVAHKRASITNDQFYTLGVMEHNRANYGAAIQFFSQAIEKNSKADHIFYALAASQAMSGAVMDALENLRRAISLNEANRIYAKNDADFAALQMEKAFATLVGLNAISHPGLSRP